MATNEQAITDMTEEARVMAIKVLELLKGSEGNEGQLAKLKAGGSLEEWCGGYIITSGWTADGGFWYETGSCRIEKDGYIVADGYIAYLLEEAGIYKKVAAYKNTPLETACTTFNGYSQKRKQELIKEGYTRFRVLKWSE